MLKTHLMHNVQDLKQKKTQTIYPSPRSLSTIHFFHFFTRITIWTADIQFTRINLSIPFSLTTHTSHKTSSDLLLSLLATQEYHARSLPRCRFMTRSVRILPDR
ncbi:hypothetical protein HanHA300_Chr15g0578951 [Helianthus annuus]|nr:hypothetical protein HanHA300_Chr15g0578951 [Helianthus annuus]